MGICRRGRYPANCFVFAKLTSPSWSYKWTRAATPQAYL